MVLPSSSLFMAKTSPLQHVHFGETTLMAQRLTNLEMFVYLKSAVERVYLLK